VLGGAWFSTTPITWAVTSRQTPDIGKTQGRNPRRVTAGQMDKKDGPIRIAKRLQISKIRRFGRICPRAITSPT